MTGSDAPPAAIVERAGEEEPIAPLLPAVPGRLAPQARRQRAPGREALPADPRELGQRYRCFAALGLDGITQEDAFKSTYIYRKANAHHDTLNALAKADMKIRKAMSDLRFALASEKMEGKSWTVLTRELKDKLKAAISHLTSMAMVIDSLISFDVLISRPSNRRC